MKRKKSIAIVLALALTLTGVSVKPLTATYAKAKSPTLQISVKVGKTQKIKLNNAGKKVKWTVAKKKVVKIVKKTGKYRNVIVIKGLKAGNTKITAKCGKKKYTIKVKVEKAKQQDSVPGTIPTTTASKVVETTVKVAETTTENAVQEQTTKEQTTTEEETTSEQIPEVPTTSEEITEEPTSEEEPETEETTTEMPTLEDVTDETQTDEELTTQEPTTEETTIEEATTEEPTTEEVTTEEETTTAPETTTRETKLVAEVLNDGLTTDDTLRIKYYFDGPTDVVLWTTGYPEILEIYENGQWIKLEYKSEWFPPIGMGGFSQEYPENLEIPLSLMYKDVRPGHYRYTHTLGPHYTYEGENPFGDSISVEFDVTYPEFYITGKVKNEKIKSTDNLEITYTIITESEEEYTCSTQPYALLEWSEPVGVPTVWSGPYDVTIEEREYETMTGSGTIDITIPLEEYFGTLLPGKYKYVHEVNGKYAGVNFEIVEEEETN